MVTVPTAPLNSGTSIPQVGLGVWQATNEQTEQAVRFAIAEAGYRHIDTAAAYRNEAGVGRGIRASGVPREELFVTTKLWNGDQGYDRAKVAFDRSLEELGLDYVDLYLIHWPLQSPERIRRTWDALTEIHASGRARAIGVCNFEPHHLEALLEHTDVVPAVNQVELHPHLPQHAVRAAAAAHGIQVEAWSPLGGTSGSGWGSASKPNTLLNDPVIARIASAHGVSPAQVLIRWNVQQGLVAIPKSVREARILQNIEVFGFALDAADLAAIATLDTGARVGAHPDEADFGAPSDWN